MSYTTSDLENELQELLLNNFPRVPAEVLRGREQAARGLSEALDVFTRWEIERQIGNRINLRTWAHVWILVYDDATRRRFLHLIRQTQFRIDQCFKKDFSFVCARALKAQEKMLGAKSKEEIMQIWGVLEKEVESCRRVRRHSILMELHSLRQHLERLVDVAAEGWDELLHSVFSVNRRGEFVPRNLRSDMHTSYELPSGNRLREVRSARQSRRTQHRHNVRNRAFERQHAQPPWLRLFATQLNSMGRQHLADRDSR
ncbi:hypothetical protein KEM55_000380 [Ascosphaera atra]|nr:hypothetical protein KEM55_000380 [Ascosphaera atra]